MQHKIQFGIPFTKKEFFIGTRAGIFPKRTERTAGTLNRTLDCRFVFYGDYDRLDYVFLVHEANVMQREFKMSDWYLFQSPDHKDGWHVITLDKFLFWELFDIIKHSSCDSAYKHGCFYTPSRSWTLRLAEKGDRDRVDFVGVIPSDYDEREKSRAHAEFVEALGATIDWGKGKFDNYHMTDVEEFKGVNLPDGTRDKVEIGGITTEGYSTASHISKKNLEEDLDK